MPELYEKGGLRFAYPENWTVDDDDQGNADVAVTVHSPQTAFWTVMWYHDPRDVRKLADCVLAALRSEYPQLEVDEIPASSMGEVVCGYDLTFSCFDLMNTATIRAFQQSGETFLILSQAEDRELPAVEPVFRAMTASLTHQF